MLRIFNFLLLVFIIFGKFGVCNFELLNVVFLKNCLLMIVIVVLEFIRVLVFWFKILIRIVFFDMWVIRLILGYLLLCLFLDDLKIGVIFYVEFVCFN